MEIPKDKILDLLREQGKDDQVGQEEQELPDQVDPEKHGLPITALVRLRYPNANYRPFHQLLATTPEIVEAHHVTGEDCFALTVRARSMRHLEEVTGRIGGLGSVTTSVVYSTPLGRRPFLPAPG